MSDHDTWNMFAAASYAAWLAGGDYAAEECRTRAVADADWFVIESKKRAEAEAAEYEAKRQAEMQRVKAYSRAYEADFAEKQRLERRSEPTPPQPDDDGLLLPCPFCGARAFVDGVWSICCNNGDCQCSTKAFGTEAEAVAAWNRRIVSEAGVTK